MADNNTDQSGGHDGVAGKWLFSVNCALTDQYFTF